MKPNTTHDRETSFVSQELIDAIRRQYALDWYGLHGIYHFFRVRANGLMLARETGAQEEVVELFAFLHDAKRLNDGIDPGHGKRAVQFIRSLQGELFFLNRPDLELLCYACEFHTDGLLVAEVTVQTCWDADRLDLGRAGIVPEQSKLCTDAARDPNVIDWAHKRSVAWRSSSM